MAELEVLRAARQAIEEGLISTQDYDVVKVAFLRAQQLKAGMDAGFIKQEDYVLARDAYLNALDLSVMAGRGPSTGGPMSTLRASASFDAPLPGAGAGPASNGPAAMPPPATQQPAARSRGPSGAAASSGAATPAGGLSAAGGVPPPAAALPLRSADSYGTSSGGGGPTASLDGGMRGRASASQDALAVPTDVPQYARQGITTGKCSMAGIGLAEDCVNLFMHLKQRSAVRGAHNWVHNCAAGRVGGREGAWAGRARVWMAGGGGDRGARLADVAARGLGAGAPSPRAVCVRAAALPPAERGAASLG